MKTHLKNHKRKQGKIEMKDELEKLIEKRKLFDFLKTEEGKEMMMEAFFIPQVQQVTLKAFCYLMVILFIKLKLCMKDF